MATYKVDDVCTQNQLDKNVAAAGRHLEMDLPNFPTCHPSAMMDSATLRAHFEKIPT
jgi:hypothetical protein